MSFLQVFEFVPWAYLPLFYLAAVAWPLARTDFREHRLPNRLVLPAFAVSLVSHAFAVISGAPSEQMLWAWLTGFAVFVVSLAANVWAGLGMGDVKLMSAIAVALGWWGSGVVVLALTAGFALAVAVTGLRVLAKRQGGGRQALKQAIPLGPYLLGGFAAASFGLML